MKLSSLLTPVVVMLGPTAVGKTDAAIAVARSLDGEIVGADSRQVYRGMDIGTAKPTADQRAAVPHHLIDWFDPDEELSVAEYQRSARTAIDAIAARGRLPILVGGTGQYLTALMEGWTIPAVPPDAELRADLEAFAAAHGWQALHDRLRALDPASAEAIDGRNIRRVVRALEVCMVTGAPFSEQRRKEPPPYRALWIGLTLPRETLDTRADSRIDAMIGAGWIDEVRALLNAGYDRRLPSMSALGYPQIAAHLLEGLPLASAVEQIRTATHQFIRRQYTWFHRHDPGIDWRTIASDSDRGALIDTVGRWHAAPISEKDGIPYE